MKIRYSSALSLALLLSCDRQGGEDLDVELFFRAVHGDDVFTCNNENGKAPATDLRLFVFDIRLLSGDGAEHPVEIQDDGQFQSIGVALLDFECLLSIPENKTIRGQIDEQSAGLKFTGLRFKVGVPPEFDRMDPQSLPPPLNDSTMLLGETPGHKFLSADHYGDAMVRAEGCEQNTSDPCAQANIAEVELHGFDIDTSTISIDRAKLFEGCGNNCRCESPLVDPWCRTMYERFGLDWMSGETIPGQTVFRIE